jgi:hypothetical protein
MKVRPLLRKEKRAKPVKAGDAKPEAKPPA